MSKISFLIPVFNAETVLERPLESLKRAGLADVEVIASLDACTDRSEEILQRYPFVKVLVNKQRLGKTLNNKKLFEAASGEIIFLLDDDHTLLCTPQQLKTLLALFAEDAKLGGVVYPIPEVINVERHAAKIKSVVAYGDALIQKFLAGFRIAQYTKTVKGRRYIDQAKYGYPFQVMIFRRAAAPFTRAVLDDSERSVQILENGYEVLVLTDAKQYPHATPFPDLAVPQRLTLEGLIRQKIRNQYGLTELQQQYRRSLGLRRFYLPFTCYVLGQCLRHPSYILPVLCASAIFLYATLAGKVLYWLGSDSTRVWGLGIKKRGAWR